MKAQIIFRYVDAVNSLGLAAVHCLKFLFKSVDICKCCARKQRGCFFL